jgi:hypothetical protein
MRELTRLWKTIARFCRQHWIGGVLILAVTLIFFMPIVVRISSYSEGGDAMFNAWTLARDQHCILRQGCPSYGDANIFFPHKDSMYYSEAQLSAGLLTLPLRFIDQNPIFSYNVWTIMSFFLMGFFMYLLAKYLSKGNEPISILAGLIFEFSPFRMAALSHLQNTSIFYLPLVFLLLFKFLDTRKRGYLIGLFAALALQFYASWYQMVFVLIAVGVLLAGLLLFRMQKPRTVLTIFLVVCLAALSTYPLAKGYTNFSKTNRANFSIDSQAKYSSSLLDYATPQSGTLLGKAFYHLKPGVHMNSYNSDSYSYYGVTLYAVCLAVLILAYKQRKKSAQARWTYRIVLIFAVIGLAGFIMSFGPLLKIRNSYYYALADGIRFTIAMPYLFVDKFLPQLSFMRALGRSGVLILFSLCSILAFAPALAKKNRFYTRHARPINVAVVVLLILELMPFHLMPMRTTSYNYNLSIPPVYQYVKSHDEVNNILILAADFDYPNAGAIPVELPEETMWSGYHNKNIYNGYSGYLPPDYYPRYYDYLQFTSEDVPVLKKDDLRYVLVNKQLSTSNPDLANQVAAVLGPGHVVYQDKTYVLFKVAD